MTDLEEKTGEARAPSLTRLERAAGVALGAQPIAPLPDGPTGSARAALERVVGRFLERTPCVVSFSGGRASSAVLAVATHVARRDGLPLPIPFTFRFPGKPLTEESDWQEHVIAHLGLEEWQRVDLHDELDLLGAIARQCLLEFGLLWPANVYLHVPVFRAAAGGTVLTGLDGDGLFGDWRWAHAQAVLHRRVAPRPRDVVRVGFALAPVPFRRAAYRRRGVFVPGWLSLAAGAEYADTVLDRAATEPRQWDRRVAWHAGARALYLAERNLEVIGARDDVRVGNPLLHPDFLAALANEGGAAGSGRPHPGDAPPGGRPPADRDGRARRARPPSVTRSGSSRRVRSSIRGTGSGSTRRSSTPSGYGPPGGPSIPCSTAGRCSMRRGWGPGRRSAEVVDQGRAKRASPSGSRGREARIIGTLASSKSAVGFAGTVGNIRWRAISSIRPAKPTGMSSTSWPQSRTTRPASGSAGGAVGSRTR